MPRRPIVPLALAFGLSVLWPPGAARTQPAARPASNITPYDAHSVVAPALPAPPVASADPPAAFLAAARHAVLVRHAEEAQEALERAETRLLDGHPPVAAAAGPDDRKAVLAIAAARRALAAHDRQGALAAIDDALATAGLSRPQVAAATAPQLRTVAPVAPQSPPAITRALLPGHWAPRGARYVWVPPETRLRRVQSAGLVPGTYVWLNGAYAWVPAHTAN